MGRGTTQPIGISAVRFRLHCASYKTKSEGSVILYKQFLSMLQDKGGRGL